MSDGQQKSIARHSDGAVFDPVNLLNLRQAAGGGGGADTVLFNVLKRIDRQRFCAAVAYLFKRGENILPIADLFRDGDIELIEVPGGRLIDPVQLYQLHRLIRRRNIHILHCHDPKADVYGVLLRWFNPGLKLVSTLHTWHIHSWRSRWYTGLDMLALRFFHLLIAVSEDTRQHALDGGLREVELMLNGVDTEFWTPVARPERQAGEKVTIGFVGRLSREKGVQDLVAIARKVLDRHPDCEFLLAGEGPEREPAEALAVRLGVAPRVRFLGLLPKVELKALYQRFDLLLMPSYSEGVPITMLEAVAMGVPVVASRVGGVGEVLNHGETALLSEAGDMDGMVCNIFKLIDEPARADELRRRGRELVLGHYAVAERVRQLEALYLNLLERR
jgi:glycosyltransferase involved in cell wall biosynthesis